MSSHLHALKCMKQFEYYEELKIEFEYLILRYQTNFTNGVDIGKRAIEFGLISISQAE